MEDQQQWKLVPVEPTKEMMIAGWAEGWSAYANYRAMLAASPSSSVLERAREALAYALPMAKDEWTVRGDWNTCGMVAIEKMKSALAEIDRALGGGNAE